MTSEELQQVRQMIKDAIEEHEHKGQDSKRLDGKAIRHAPQPAITAAVGGVADATFGAPEADIVNNHTTQIGEIVNALIILGFIKD